MLTLSPLLTPWTCPESTSSLEESEAVEFSFKSYHPTSCWSKDPNKVERITRDMLAPDTLKHRNCREGEGRGGEREGEGEGRGGEGRGRGRGGGRGRGRRGGEGVKVISCNNRIRGITRQYQEGRLFKVYEGIEVVTLSHLHEYCSRREDP